MSLGMVLADSSLLLGGLFGSIIPDQSRWYIATSATAIAIASIRLASAVIEAVVKRDDNNDDIDASKDKKGKGSGVVFLLWGKPASLKLKAQTVLSKHPRNNRKNKHAVIMCSHPSPLGATKTNAPFMGSRCFSRKNGELKKRGWSEIGLEGRWAFG